MEIVLKEEQLWCQFEYMLKAEKYKFNVTFITEEGDFVASFKPANRSSKGLPISEVSAKFTKRFYKREELKIPTSLKEMHEILKERTDDLHRS